jgi:hypothetical protein
MTTGDDIRRQLIRLDFLERFREDFGVVGGFAQIREFPVEPGYRR